MCVCVLGRGQFYRFNPKKRIHTLGCSAFRTRSADGGNGLPLAGACVPREPPATSGGGTGAAGRRLCWVDLGGNPDFQPDEAPRGPRGGGGRCSGPQGTTAPGGTLLGSNLRKPSPSPSRRVRPR